ncbi:hypothetical protein BDZ89DRAFT_960923 [Hymenopellis radicata]|nr:hypothetical protein BDZ89DRAFT_960923 [Hymenopellis radicata]
MGFPDILVVREQYDVVRKMLERTDRQAFVVTGHPGIGKTTFLLYLLLYRFERKLSTAVQLSNDHYFIFDEHGARARQLTYNDPRLQKCWALANSNNSLTQPCRVFSSRAQRVIQITPPTPERWKEWAKQCRAAIIVMDLPKVMEIGAVLKELRLDVAVTLSLVGRWGPSIRTVITIVEDPGLVPQYHAAAKGAGRDLAMMPSSALVASGVGRLPTSHTSNILFIRPEGGSTGSLTPSVKRTIPTKFLSEFLDGPSTLLTSESSLDLFMWLSSHSLLTLTRTCAGWRHEMDMHRHMCTEGNVVHLYGIGKQDQMDLMSPSRVLSGTESSLKCAPAAQGFYWMPSVVDFPGIDGILGDINGDVFALQATTVADHVDPHEGLKRAWTAMSTRAHCHWNYVLVCSSQEDVEALLDVFVPQLKDLKLGDQCPVKVWVSVIDNLHFRE